MSYLIIGASSGLGRELAYSFAKKGHNLTLVSRDKRDLVSIKSDLELRYEINIKIIPLDFDNTEEIEKKLFKDEEIIKNLQGILFPVGFMSENDTVNLNKDDAKKLLNINFLSICFTISKFEEKFQEKFKKNRLLIVGFGSVSGLLGRDLNSNYAAAKRALESYFESLAFSKNNNIDVHFYILGYLNTNLAFGHNLKLPIGNVSKLSEVVYKNKDKKFLKTYYPYYWNVIALILKITPLTLILKLKKLFNK